MTKHARTEEPTVAQALGIDIGGSGIKGAIVDVTTGEFVGERHRIATPQPATPQAVAETVAEIVAHFGWTGPVGITVPAVVRHRIVRSAANIDASWIGVDSQQLFGSVLQGVRFSVLNDADAAGLAEVACGDPTAARGPVIFLTLGTGIGSAFLLNGQLFPNTELGHLRVGKHEAEHIASSAVREREGLSYKKWAKQLDKVLAEYTALFNPEAFIIGGGISRKFDKWCGYLDSPVPVVPAQLRNRAGIVGAALAVSQDLHP
ncbi:ROK family protein [Corynebacterium lizhenjunii]|uniref:ROK family protein n=1 Tax=Corynebacterium lizhenjunii TaxID=2709394 RepID=A0A7T0KDM2_9CORY|nr:ROK family protein [Corynebacterium lizhenjunii]QPK78325.1 ROK family protein [Corynebacterium lizhenjunii]